MLMAKYLFNTSSGKKTVEFQGDLKKARNMDGFSCFNSASLNYPFVVFHWYGRAMSRPLAIFFEKFFHLSLIEYMSYLDDGATWYSRVLA